MTAATGRRPVSTIGEDAIPAQGGGPVAASAKWYQGWLLARNAAGNLVPMTAALNLTSAGIAVDDIDAAGYSAGDIVARTFEQVSDNLEIGTVGDALVNGDAPCVCYGIDNQTVGKTDGVGTRSIAGVFLGINPDNSKARVWVGPAAHAVAQAMAIRASVDALTATAPIVTDEWTNAIASDAAGLKAATATQVAAQTILAAAMLAGGKAELAARPRNLTFTTGGTAANAPASAAITGTDIDGAALTESVTLSQTAGIDEGVKAFKTVTSVVYGIGGGTDATIAIGFGKKFGLSKTPKSRAGRLAAIQEVAAGSVVTTGALVAPATAAPHGTYAPSAEPDGSKDFALTYEQVV